MKTFKTEWLVSIYLPSLTRWFKQWKQMKMLWLPGCLLRCSEGSGLQDRSKERWESGSAFNWLALITFDSQPSHFPFSQMHSTNFQTSLIQSIPNHFQIYISATLHLGKPLMSSLPGPWLYKLSSMLFILSTFLKPIDLNPLQWIINMYLKLETYISACLIQICQFWSGLDLDTLKMKLIL